MSDTISGRTVYTAYIGRQIYGRLAKECGVYSSRDKALAALRYCLPDVQDRYPGDGYSERDFVIDEDVVDPP